VRTVTANRQHFQRELAHRGAGHRVVGPRFALIALLVACLVAGCSSKDVSGEGIEAANARYEAGDYVGAVMAYERLVAQGIESGVVYYNLGNAHFKLGDLGRAILNYSRAQRLLPRDEDVATNLELARAQTLDRLEANDGDAMASLVNRALMGWTSPNETAAIALGLWAALCLVGVIALVRPRARRTMGYVALIVGLLLLIALLSLGGRMVQDQRRPPGLIVAQQVEVRSGPGDDYLVEFSLHSGTEIAVLDQRAGWWRIALPGGLEGWLPAEAAERVSLAP